MKADHPYEKSARVELIKHVNGVSVGIPYNRSSDALMPTTDMHVFTSFKELTQFLRGWWPDDGKE